VNWIMDLENTKRMMKDLERDKKNAEDQIARRMVDADTVTDANGVPIFTWKEQRGRVSFNAKAFEADHPDLFAQYRREGAPFRVMRIPAGGKK